MNNKVCIRRLASGVPGLDAILGGGLPEYSFNLIVGAPGSGKTTLAHQIMFALATHDRPALFFTVLGEPPLKMLRYQQQFSFFDLTKIDDSIHFVNLSVEVSGGNFALVLARITQEVEALSPGLIFIDSFRSIMLEAQNSPNSSISLQQFIQQIGAQFSGWQATTFLVGEHAVESDTHPVFSVADGLLALEQNVYRNSMVRRIQVLKMRGQSTSPGMHTFRISNDGIRVFPAAIIDDDLGGVSELSTPHPSETRLTMGVPKLDEMLGGGLPSGYSMLVAGPSGSGKTILATAFLTEGVRLGEAGVMVAFEQTPSQSRSRTIDDMVRAGCIGLINTRSLDLSIDEIVQNLIDQIHRMKATRVVIDSLSGFELAIAPTFREDFRESLFRMVAVLSGIGVTVLMTSELEDRYTDLRFSPYGSAFLTDAIIVQRYIELDSRLKRVMAVVKVRGSAHSDELRQFEITDAGIVIGDPVREYEGFSVGGQRKHRHLGTVNLRVPMNDPLADREAAVVAGERAADQRQDNADRRQDRADLRQEAADLRQETADLRQETADLRQHAADLSDQAALTKAELGRITEAQLREANERLVIAMIRAQTMAEVAEGAATRMSYMAEHDFLTSLPNRALLSARLGQSIALAQRHGKRVALLYMDLDHFKHINDSLGHAVGDQLLQFVAKRLQACVRVSDTVCRQGGDEFVVLLAEVESANDAELAAEKLIEAMAEPYLIGSHRLHVTLSIGISLYPDHGDEAETVLSNADIAMYHAKRSGRNKYQMFTPDMNVRAVARQSVQQALHQALEQREFVLHYQPKVNLESGAITGAEALIRVRLADQSLLGPTQFVNIAEDSGLILPIGKWVLREACRQTREWLQAGLAMGQIAVNVSVVEFHSKDFLAGVRAILDETGLDPRHLELEVTESGLMHDTETTTAVLLGLKALGVQIAIDDFGTGYSSLSYLQRFPIDTLKIDQSFVDDIDGESGGAIVRAVVAMCMSLELKVVAEGIELPGQLSYLRSLRCTEGQGFYFSQPVPAEQFAALLRAGQPLGITASATEH